MAKPYDLGMICGRFHTFHVGHQSLVDAAVTLCDRVVIMVGSAQEYGTERNPLNIITRFDMLREIYDDREKVMIYPVADLTNENDITTDWGKYLLENVKRYVYKKPELMVYGNDESRSLWFSTDDIKDTSELIINRGKIPISATELRNLMVFDKREEWMEWVNPKLHKMYDTLRKELMTVDFYKTM